MIGENLEEFAGEEEAAHEEANPEGIELPEGNVDLVKLIDQPEWKTILIELVKTERMDPWNIDISELADKYLKRINELGGNDLRLPANAILASAILLRFKSRVLKLSSIDDEDEDEFLQKKEREGQLIDEFLPELKAIRKIREGRITLDELVDAVENILVNTKKKGDRKFIADRPEFTLPFSPIDIEKKMKEVYSQITKMVDSEGLVLFSALVEGKRAYEIVDSFVPVLYLTNEGKINTWQDEWFGEIFISLNQENEDKNKSK